MPPNNHSDQSGNADGGDEPTSKEHQIAVAIDSFKAQYKAAQSDSSDHEKKAIIWTRWAAVGVFIYTAITVGIFITSIYQTKIAKDSLIAANRALIFGQRALGGIRTT